VELGSARIDAMVNGKRLSYLDHRWI